MSEGVMGAINGPELRHEEEEEEEDVNFKDDMLPFVGQISPLGCSRLVALSL